MNGTHDYETRTVKVTDLTNEDVLVGGSGGLSAVYSRPIGQTSVMIQTEHGILVFDPDAFVNVLVA